MRASDRRAVWIALLAALVSFGVRELNNLRVRTADGASWFSLDPDGLYHMRRVDRALEEGLPIAAYDPFLAFSAARRPEDPGAAIPWPPYTTLVLRTLVAPFAPREPAARRDQVERFVATAPAVFSALTSGLVALFALRFAGPLAGIVAGLHHAFVFGALKYGHVGNGDHHAWVSLLLLAMLGLAGSALTRASLADRGRSFFLGTSCGVLAGLAMGSSVAAILHVALLQLVLGVWLVRHAREPAPGLARFAVAFHAAAILVLAPAVVQSPWSRTDPLSVVTLSWFHPLELALGMCAFVPLGVLTPAARRRYPAIVLAAAVLLVAATPFGAGLRAAFAWLGARDRFLDWITESQPLLGGAAGGVGPALKFLGWDVLVLPCALWIAARAVLARRADGLLVWLVATPVLVAMALLQRRFAEPAAAPVALMLGVFAASLAARPSVRAPRATALAAAVLVVLANPSAAGTSWTRLVHGVRYARTPELERQRGQRALAEWLRQGTPDPGSPPAYAVLAQWDLGHLIEWAGGRPTVASQFGVYLGEASYLDPWRFFLAEDEREARALLERRGARYVLLTDTYLRNLGAMVSLLRPERAEELLDEGWRHTVGGRLLRAGLGEPGVSAPSFLRLVHAEPTPTGVPASRGRPCGWIYERVDDDRGVR